MASLFYISYNNIRIDNRYLSRRMVKKLLYRYRHLELCGIALILKKIKKYRHCAVYLPAQCRFCLFSLGQHDRKGRAFAGGAFYLHLCADQFQNPLDQCHAKAIALGGVARVALVEFIVGQHRTIPALRLKHRSGSCGTASALPKCSIRHPVLSALLA